LRDNWLANCLTTEPMNELIAAWNELIEAWKARRAMLARQLEMLESGEMQHGQKGFGDLVQQDIARTKSWIAELDALLAEHPSD
jgi:hypothetical protein